MFACLEVIPFVVFSLSLTCWIRDSLAVQTDEDVAEEDSLATLASLLSTEPQVPIS